jgi:hypothetical protein
MRTARLAAAGSGIARKHSHDFIFARMGRQNQMRYLPSPGVGWDLLDARSAFMAAAGSGKSGSGSSLGRLRPLPQKARYGTTPRAGSARQGRRGANHQEARRLHRSIRGLSGRF